MQLTTTFSRYDA